MNKPTLGMSAGPATVTLTTFKNRSVDVDAFENRDELLRYLVRTACLQLSYDPHDNLMFVCELTVLLNERATELKIEINDDE